MVEMNKESSMKVSNEYRSNSASLVSEDTLVMDKVPAIKQVKLVEN
jgi:hypothetical protein